MNLELKKAFENSKVTKLKSLIEIESKWDDFIEIINDGYQVDLKWNLTPEQSELFDPVGNIKFYDRLTMMVSQVHYSGLKEVEKVKNIIALNEMTYRGAAAAISLTNAEKTTRRHSDQVNVLYVQCIGTVRWEVWPDEIQESYILEPGDAIFVPLKTYHEVTSITSRVGLTFAVDLNL